MVKTISVRVDEHTKIAAEEMLEELGLNMTTYLNMALKAFVREKQLPFQVSLTEKSKVEKNAEYLAKLDQSINQAENGEVLRYTKEQRLKLGNN